MALDHHVDAVDGEVLEDARVVRDDEHGSVAGLAIGVHAAGDYGESIDVQAGVGLVEDGEFGLQKQQLQHLDLLLFAARKTYAQLTVEVGSVHVELGGKFFHAAAKLLALHLQAGAAGDAGAQEAGEGHAGNFDRCLEGKE